MVKLKFIDIMILLVIGATIALGIWLLFGSPTELQAIITISVFFGSTGLMLWKYVFEIDKKTEISFIKLRNDMDNRFDRIEDKLNVIGMK